MSVTGDNGRSSGARKPPRAEVFADLEASLRGAFSKLSHPVDQAFVAGLGLQIAAYRFGHYSETALRTAQNAPEPAPAPARSPAAPSSRSMPSPSSRSADTRAPPPGRGHDNNFRRSGRQ